MINCIQSVTVIHDCFVNYSINQIIFRFIFIFTVLSYLCLNVLQIIDQEINPYVDKWEEEGQFPAHKIFKILGSAGFLGVNKPVGKQTFATSDVP